MSKLEELLEQKEKLEAEIELEKAKWTPKQFLSWLKGKNVKLITDGSDCFLEIEIPEVVAYTLQFRSNFTIHLTDTVYLAYESFSKAYIKAYSAFYPQDCLFDFTKEFDLKVDTSNIKFVLDTCQKQINYCKNISKLFGVKS